MKFQKPRSCRLDQSQKAALVSLVFAMATHIGFSQDCLNATEITLCNQVDATITDAAGNWNFYGAFNYIMETTNMGHIIYVTTQGSFATNGLEHYYSFKPTVTGSYYFDANPKGNTNPIDLGYDMGGHFMFFYKPVSAGCDENNWIEIGTYGNGVQTSGDQKIFNLSKDTAYYFMLDGETNLQGGLAVNFTLCKTDEPNCTDAPTIASCTNVDDSIPGGIGAWNFDTNFPDPGFGGQPTPGNELIYKFIPPATDYYTLGVLAANNRVNYYFKKGSGDCENIGWRKIASYDAPGTKSINEQLIQDSTYYFLLDNGSTNASSQTFQICKSAVVNCSPYSEVTACNPVTISIETGIGLWDFAGTYPDNSVGGPSVGKEKFASFTPSATGNYYMEVTNANGGNVSYLYKPAGECSNTGWTGIATFNAPGGKNIGPLQQGVSYYFVLDNNDNTVASSQTFKICPTPQPNCLPVSDIYQYSTINATIPAGVGFWDNYPPDNSLANATGGKEIFFKFIPLSTSKFSISQTSGLPSKFYYKQASADCDNNNWKPFPSTEELQKGIPYLILADQNNITENKIVFTIDEDGEFLCPGESIGLNSFLESYMGLGGFWSFGWSSNNDPNFSYQSTSEPLPLYLTDVPSSHYGYTYQATLSGLNYNYDIIIFTSPVYTLKFRSYWTGAISTDWNEPGNWNCNAVPDENTDVIIPKTTNQPILETNASVKKLFVLTGASVTVKPTGNLFIKG